MSPARLSRFEAGMRLVLEFNKAFNRHDVAAMTQLMSEDCIVEDIILAPDGAVYKGKGVVAQFWQDFFRASPRAHIEIEEILGFGMRCVVRWRYSWMDEAGQERHVRGLDIFHVKNGLIYEKLSYIKGASGITTGGAGDVGALR